jgi:hypothetical protein
MWLHFAVTARLSNGVIDAQSVVAQIPDQSIG